jgi:hypothetical protein
MTTMQKEIKFVGVVVAILLVSLILAMKVFGLSHVWFVAIMSFIIAGATVRLYSVKWNQ